MFLCYYAIMRIIKFDPTKKDFMSFYYSKSAQLIMHVITGNWTKLLNWLFKKLVHF